MLHRIRLELTVAAALAVAIAALVLAIRGGAAEQAPVVEGQAAEVNATNADGVPQGAVEVEIVDFAYSPEPVRVSVGTPIVWTNQDLAAHTVTALDRAWDSKIMAQGDTFVATFDEPGVYVYICELHPPGPSARFRAAEGVKLVGGGGSHGKGMQGTIIVE